MLVLSHSAVCVAQLGQFCPGKGGRTLRSKPGGRPVPAVRAFPNFFGKKEDGLKTESVALAKKTVKRSFDFRDDELDAGMDTPPEGGDIPDYIPSEFYTLLDVEPTASLAEIKEAYRRLQKVCHPDVCGDSGEEVCMLLNEAWETLSQPEVRKAYDDTITESNFYSGAIPGAKSYTGESFSKWVGSDPRGGEWNQRSVFVDEGTCIGCKNCNHCAANTFRMEEEYGRARVFAQWADTEEDIQTAIDSCPVDCIHWVKKRNLPVLEFVMQTATRLPVSMQTGASRRSQDPFDLANSFIRKQRDRAEKMGRSGGSMPAPARLREKVSSAWLKLNKDVRRRWSRYAEWADSGGQV